MSRRKKKNREKGFDHAAHAVKEQQRLKAAEEALKPRTWDEHVGQQRMKRILQVQIQAAADRFERLGDVLLIGGAGTGKSSLAALIAQETNDKFYEIMMTPNFKMPHLNKALLELDPDETWTVLIDEIHNINKREQHYLYPILQERQIASDTGKLTPIEAQITFIAATTEPQALTRSLQDRFDITHRFAAYTDEEMAEVIKVLGNRLGVAVNENQALALGRASAGTPRQARTLVLAARDLGEADPEGVFDLCGITEDGLTEDHISYLEALANLGGSHVGIDNIANHSGRSKEVVFGIEKLLIDKKLIEISKSGRTLMATGRNALRKAVA